MSTKYDFYQNPSPKGDKQAPKLHARVVFSRTTGTDTLAEEIQDCCSLSTADVKGVLTALTNVSVRRMREGERIHLEGFGYFHMTLSCPPIRSPKEIRAESIRFKSVAFRPEQKLKDRLARTSFERNPEKRHSKRYSSIEIDGILTSHFLDHESISRTEFQRICGLTRSTAIRKLKQLQKEGKLQRCGHFRFPLYEPVKGYYRR